MKTTKRITLSAVMVAMSTVLVFVSKLIPSLPNGGQITIASMVPVILVSLILGTKWGIMASLAYALIQIITGFYPPPTQNLLNFFLVIMLDYIVAFGVLGFSGMFIKAFNNKKMAYLSGTFVVVFVRYICHILSGVLIWGVYAPSGYGIWMYSIVYNGSYMIPEIIISVSAVALLIPVLNKHSIDKI